MRLHLLYLLALFLFTGVVGAPVPTRSDTYVKRVIENQNHGEFVIVRRMWNVLKVCLKKANLNLKNAHPAGTITINPFTCDDSADLETQVLNIFKKLLPNLYASAEKKAIASLTSLAACLTFMRQKPLPNVSLTNMASIKECIDALFALGKNVKRVGIDIDILMTHINAKIVRTMSRPSPIYIGAFIPQMFEGSPEQPHCSGHVTLAYGQQVKKELHRVGTTVSVRVSPTCVFWTDSNGRQHGYYPAEVDGKPCHVSMLGDPSPGMNGGHCDNNPVAPSDTWTTFTSFVMPFYNNGNHVSFDMDGTLVEPHLAFINGKSSDINAVLQDPTQIASLKLTHVGEMFVQLNKLNRNNIDNVPKLYLVTSRREYNVATMRQCVADKFGVHVDQISFGSKIGRGDDEFRSNEKANCKLKRARDLGIVMHFDDESTVAQEFANNGFTGILYNHLNQDITNVQPSENASQSREYVKIMLSGYPGAGKTTLANDLTHRLQINGFQVYFAATDSGDSDPDHLPAFKHVPPGGKLAVIFDATGDGMIYPANALVINFSQDTATLIGSICSVFGRKTHATLNGIQSNEHTTDQDDLTHLNRIFKNNMNIVELVKFYRNVYQNDWNAIIANFTDNRYDVSYTLLPSGNIILGICYVEGFQHWVSTWGRDARNIYLLVTPDDVVILKACLQAGCEIKPVEETNGDVYHRVFGRFQQWLRDAICSGKCPTEATYLSSKVDGCLAQINIMYGQSMYDIMMEHPSLTDFNRALIDETWKTSGQQWFCTIASNGTLLAGKPIEPTFVTAIASHYKIDHLPTDSLMTVWQKCVQKLTASLTIYENGMHALVSETTPSTSALTLQFEAVCPNRTTFAFADREAELHKELTADYPEGMCVYLGAALSHNNIYMPHFTHEKLVTDAGFTQPPYWKVNDRPNNNMVIPSILDDLELVSLGHMTSEQFFEKWRPDNTMPHHGKIDLEGFVLLVKYNKTYEYNKLKTLLYYMVHKPNLNNIEELTQAVNGSDAVLKAFPKLKILHDVNNAFKSWQPLTSEELYENVLNNVQYADTTEKFIAAKQKIYATGDHNLIVKFILGNRPKHLIGANEPTVNMQVANYIYARLGLTTQIQLLIQQPRVCNDPNFTDDFYNSIVGLVQDIIHSGNGDITKLRSQVAANLFS